MLTNSFYITIPYICRMLIFLLLFVIVANWKFYVRRIKLICVTECPWITFFGFFIQWLTYDNDYFYSADGVITITSNAE